MLVVVAIVLIMVSLTAIAVSNMSNSDRIRSSARTVQSALLGARDRAAFAKQPRGLRFLLDPDRPWVSTSMVYVAPSSDSGTLQICYSDLSPVGTPSGNGNPDDDGDGLPGLVSVNYNGFTYTYNEGDRVALRRPPGALGTSWVNLYNQGLLRSYARITLTSGSGTSVYTVDTRRVAAGEDVLTLTTSYPDPPSTGCQFADYVAAPAMSPALPTAYSTTFDYTLELVPSVLPGQEPIQLSSGIAIDLSRSQVPVDWFQQQSYPTAAIPSGWATRMADPNTATNTIAYQSRYTADVIFTPQGRISGALSAEGLIHLYMTESQDIDNDTFQNTYLNSQTAQGDKILATIFTANGNVGTFLPDLTDADAANGPDDIFKYAKRGAAANR
jgi:type II secretory pathway pseudopilin PulG